MLSQRKRRIAGGISVGVATLGAAGAIAAQTHPAAAGALFAAMTTAITCTNNSSCISGANTSTGIGVLGTSSTGTAVSGRSQNGDGIDGLSYNTLNTYGVGVKGTTANGQGFGMFGIAGNGVGVAGLAVNGIGVYGNASDTAGATGTGVLGRGAASGVGVTAENDYGGTALRATTTNYGIAMQANSPGGVGVYGTSNSGVAAYFGSNSAEAVWANNNGGLYSPAVYGNNSGSGYGGRFVGAYGGVWGEAPDYPLVATDQNQHTVFDVNASGDIYYTGGLNSYSRAADGSTVAAYSAKSTLPTVEDTGTAKLSAGNATVRLDSTFAKTIDLSAAYRVFVTADGDTRGLYVASRTANGFVVHENQGGRSSVTFEYRIVATALGHAGQRMAVADSAAVTPEVPKMRNVMPAVKPFALPRLPPMPARP